MVSAGRFSTRLLYLFRRGVVSAFFDLLGLEILTPPTPVMFASGSLIAARQPLHRLAPSFVTCTRSISRLVSNSDYAQRRQGPTALTQAPLPALYTPFRTKKKVAAAGGGGGGGKKGAKKAPPPPVEEVDEEEDVEEDKVDADRPEFETDVYEKEMSSEVTRFKTELDSLRVGRVNPALLETVMVTHKGTRVPVSRLAQVNVKDAQTLMVIMNEEEHTSLVDKAIRAADLGLNPQPHAAGVLKVPIPKLTAEYKATMVKKAAQDAEKSRNRVRGVRSTARTDLKKHSKLPADTRRRLEKELEDVTKHVIKEIDGVLASKQKDIEKA
ncbi:hypothetical protein HDU87_004789 [Geranomyces variabilis]|uniref:Ribosome recycling factor domain-containing protein n=1 Tax=Geranomyces variabilis TaxID=109894 RepID=A0AAD5TIB2_9FUNG|nr:hypothetical protein HDU87_004789 [Geranomyces variabilis]